MTWIQALWTLIALISIVALIPLGARVLRRRREQSALTRRNTWLIAATSSATMLVFIAAKVGDIIPNATAVDVGALAITGVLTGLFLGFGLTRDRTHAQEGQ